MIEHNPASPQIAWSCASGDMSDFLTEGLIIELDPDAADLWGAFEERAVTEAQAWAANSDLSLRKT